MNKFLILILLIGSSATKVFAGVDIVASIKPLQLIAQEIAGPDSVVSLLVPPNQSPHHFALKPSDARKVARAQMIVWIGPGMEIFLKDLLSLIPDDSVVIESMSLTGLRKYPLDRQRRSQTEPLADSQVDAHIWLDTGNATLIAAEIVKHLLVLDPTNSSLYKNNMEKFVARLTTLRAEMAEELNAIRGVKYAVYHNAFQYFEMEFGLKHQFEFVQDSEIPPGVRQLLNARKLTDEKAISCVIKDVSARSAIIDTVLADRKIKVVTADLLGQHLSTVEHSYAGLMSRLKDNFLTCLK